MSVAPVAVTFLERVEDRLSGRLLGQGDGEANMCRDVVARRLEAEAILHRQGVPDHPERLPATGGVLLVMRGPGGAEVFVRVAIALIDLDDRLDIAAILAPVGPHARPGGVSGADPVQLA